MIDITPDLIAPLVLEQNNYLPYGTRIQDPNFAMASMGNRWRYAGKEEQDFTPFSTLNLSLLDFGARMYDPFIARWTAVDPLARRYTHSSPFIYCANSPINYVDPQGDSIIVSRTGFILEQRGDDNDVYYIDDDDGEFVNIGTLGGEINIDDIYSNLLSEDAKHARLMVPFKLKKMVKDGGEWDLKLNKQTIYGIDETNSTIFVFNGTKMEAQDVGNHHFGVVIKSNVFIGESIALRLAGNNQIKKGLSMPE